MDCSHVREHLSDYIDEGLEAKTKALVEEHLSACKDCRQEVASLRMLIRDLGSMEPVAPPKDFLDQLHRRMERRSRFSQILYTLSYPMRVKLPMKLAGAVVMAVLVFTIFRIQEDQYGTKVIPPVLESTQPESTPSGMAKPTLETEPQEETYSPGVAGEKEKPTPQTARVIAQKDEAKRLPENAVKIMAPVETKAGHPSREGAPIEQPSMKTTPLVRGSTQSEPSPPEFFKAPLEAGGQGEAEHKGRVWERVKSKPQTVQTVAQIDEVRSLSDTTLKRITHVETKADYSSKKEGLIELSLVIDREQQTDLGGATLDMEAPQGQETKMRERLTMGEPVPTTQLEGEKKEISIEHFLPRLSDVIERSGGEIVSVDYKVGIHIPESVCVEIPAEQIGMFQNDLQTLGTLHGAPIAPTGEDEEVIPIRIKLLTP